MKLWIGILVAVIIGAAIGVVVYKRSQSSIPAASTQNTEPAPAPSPTTTMILETNYGKIKIALDANAAPKTSANFAKLAGDGFYNGLTFHRVIKGFMIQGGDPKGDGTGGPGYTFADELDPSSPAARRGYVRGTVAMANSGSNTNGSQFFIMHQDYQLAFDYTIFGQVTEGMDVVDRIAQVKTDAQDKPLEPVIINKAYVGN